MSEQPHTLVTTATGYHCTTCDWHWKHFPREACPGVKRYASGEVPSTLLTYTKLRRRNLKPGGPPVGAYRRARSPYAYLYFYDLATSLPRRIATEKQRAALAKARAALKEQHTCKRCGYYDEGHGRGWYARKYHHTVRNGYCYACERYLIWIHDRHVLEHTMRVWFEREDMPFVVLDAETTGLPDHPGFQVVEIAVVDKQGAILFHHLIKPDIPMPASASEVNGITDAMLADAPRFPEVWPELEQLLSTHEIWCYNAAFDWDALLSTAARYQLKVPRRIKDGRRWHCMMLEYAAYHGEYSSSWEDWKWQPLWVACKELEVEGNDFHRARGDALNCLGIMRALAARADTRPAPEAFPNEAP